MLISEAQIKYSDKIDALDLEVIIGLVLNKPREFVLAHPETKISFWRRWLLEVFVERRRRGEPLAYITGHKEFFGLDFIVDKNTLVPRPETELLVENAIEEIKKFKPEETILIDVGTGSGCIPISIAKYIQAPLLRIDATDISTSALLVARKNARKHGVKITFWPGNLLEPLKEILELAKNNSCLIITANLPYGWKGWTNESAVESLSLKHEPEIALFTGKNGLQLYEELLEQIKKYIELKNFRVTCLFEFDPRQNEEISKMIYTAFPNADLEIKKDLAGRDRLAIFHFSS